MEGERGGKGEGNGRGEGEGGKGGAGEVSCPPRPPVGESGSASDDT